VIPDPTDFTPTKVVPSADVVLQDPTVSYWLKNALATALQRDPVKAALDAQLLFEVLDARACLATEAALRHLSTQTKQEP